MRRRKKNPSAGLVLLGVTIAAGAAAALAFVLREKTGTDIEDARIPLFTGMSQRDADSLVQKDDCITAVNGAQGFKVQGIATGNNVLLRVTQATNGAPFFLAVPIDPLLPSNLPVMQVPVAAVSGAATPGVGGC